VGYRGKVAEQEQARALRAQGRTMPDIAAELGVSRGSVSLWTRDVPFEARPRVRARNRGPNALQRARQTEIERLLDEGRSRIGELNDRELLIAGTALYAGEGFKRDGAVGMANTDPRILRLFCAWLRTFFTIDETRLRVRIYLHEGLGLHEAMAFWSQITGIPPEQFRKPYRARADASRRHTKHPMGCPAITYSCSATHRAIMGLVATLLT
jgi:transcriptional regulator with XRE-family HTH domain